MPDSPTEYSTFFQQLLHRVGTQLSQRRYTLTQEHYQKIAIIDGDYIFVSFVPSAQQPGQPMPFRLEWRRQTGGEAALRPFETANRTRLEATFGADALEWDYKPNRIAALLNLWYSGPGSDAARLDWAVTTAPRFVAALRTR